LRTPGEPERFAAQLSGVKKDAVGQSLKGQQKSRRGEVALARRRDFTARYRID